MQAPAARPRPGGGFNPGMGQFNDHLDEQAMQQAMKQKALGQQAGSQTGPIQNSSQQSNTQQPPPEAGSASMFDTIVSKPVQDLAKTILGALHLDKLLGLGGNTSTPEEKAKKDAMMRRYNQLTEEQQAVARQKYQERMQREKMLQQEAEQRKQMEEKKKEASIQMPSSPQKGAPDPHGSKKSNAIQKLQQDRKTLGGPQSAG
jgi:hypothetical protein